MAHTPHELHEEFPDHADKMHELKLSDAHFQKLAAEYHEVNREIHRIESGVEAAGDVREEDLRKKRLSLKDEIASILAKS